MIVTIKLSPPKEVLSELVEADGLLVDEINMGIFSPADMTAI